MGYSKKAVKGIGWAGFLQIALKGSALLKFVIIAKFLTPVELGIFGIALLTIGFFQAITETGISAYLVQVEKEEEKYISPAWLLSMGRGVLLFLLTVIVAYPISLFFLVNKCSSGVKDVESHRPAFVRWIKVNDIFFP